MLRASEFTVGSLQDAAGLTLLLPRTRYEQVMLVASVGDARHAVFLTGEYLFRSFDCSTNSSWSGLLVPGIRIEVDQTSLFDPDQEPIPLGALVRAKDHISLRCQQGDRYSRSAGHLLPLVTNLSPTAGDARAGFLSWQIVLRSGTETELLHEVEIARPAAR